jgi:hypothetical protein
LNSNSSCPIHAEPRQEEASRPAMRHAFYSSSIISTPSVIFSAFLKDPPLPHSYPLIIASQYPWTLVGVIPLRPRAPVHCAGSQPSAHHNRPRQQPAQRNGSDAAGFHRQFRIARHVEQNSSLRLNCPRAWEVRFDRRRDVRGVVCQAARHTVSCRNCDRGLRNWARGWFRGIIPELIGRRGPMLTSKEAPGRSRTSVCLRPIDMPLPSITEFASFCPPGLFIGNYPPCHGQLSQEETCWN